MNNLLIRATLLPVIFFVQFSFAQSNHPIQGYLKTAGQKPLAGATISLLNAQRKIIAYKRSDDKGYFSFSVPDTITFSSLVLEVRFLGYKKVTQNISEKQQLYQILMETEEINLQEIEIKNQVKVRSKNDTVKYDVSSFNKNEDRSIGDVLSRMPGMEVSEGGQVKYNGKAISTMYINGDDLLSDKYAIGTKAIPYDMVKTVEVLKNHEPKKALKNKTLSDDVALNLVIRDEAQLKLANQIKAAAGLPGQYEGEYNAILFNKKFKTLSVLKGNNIGTDLSGDFTSFAERSSSIPSPFLSAGTAGTPPVAKQRYFFNRSGSLNANNLINLKDSLQFRINVNALADRNRLGYTAVNETYIGTDTIRYTELQQDVNKPLMAALALTLELNKAKKYVKNEFKLAYNRNNGASLLTSNGQQIAQKTVNRIQEFSNSFYYIPEFKNRNTLSFFWNLNHFNRPELLSVSPGLNEDVLNNGALYNSLQQEVEIPVWQNKLAISYLLSKGKIKQSYEIGVLNEFQKLTSGLLLVQPGGDRTAFLNSSPNNLKWSRQQVYVKPRYEYKKERWEGSFYVPLSLQYINYKDASFNLDEEQIRLRINPNLRVKYFVTAEDFVSFNYDYANNTGNISDIYRGAILQNYRTLRANDAPLRESNTQRYELQFGIQRSSKMFFVNFGLGYDINHSNTILSDKITDNILQTIVLPFENNVVSKQAKIGISKYLNFIGSTANLNVIWRNSRLNQLQNDVLLPFNNISLLVNPNIEVQLFKDMRLRYNANYTWITSRYNKGQQTAQGARIRIFDQAARISWTLPKNIDVQVSLRQNSIHQSMLNSRNYLFADATLRYKLNSLKADIELNLYNLTNIKSYESYLLSENHFWQSRYNLRERAALLKIIISL